MSIGSTGIGQHVAGLPAAQLRGGSVERAAHDAQQQQRTSSEAEQADRSAGVGEADGQDHQTNDRDADGRRLWEFSAPAKRDAAEELADNAPRDATGERGNLLDLSG